MCGGGFIGDALGSVGDFIGDVGGFVGDAVSDTVDVVKDAGSWIDDKVNDEIPGGWGTVAAVTGATYFGMPTEFGFGEAAAGAESSPWLLGGSEATSPFGISMGGGGEFGVFNPSTMGGFGIDTSSLGAMDWLGGAGSLAAGTAGLSAAQLANAAMAGQYGSNAASGLGYLGGASSLPSGTAGIQGVSSTPIWDKVKKVGESFLDGQQQQQGNSTSMLLAKGLGGSQQDIPLSYNMNQSPFQFTTQLPIQNPVTPQADSSIKAESLDFNKINQNLASLLRNQ